MPNSEVFTLSVMERVVAASTSSSRTPRAVPPIILTRRFAPVIEVRAKGSLLEDNAHRIFDVTPFGCLLSPDALLFV
jgi:hypothetical protein